METADPMILLTENKREKIFGNLLTNHKIYDIIITKDEGKENPKKPERNLKMKKTTMQFIATYLSENAQYADENEKTALESALTEINAELSKGKAKADANRALYDEYHDRVIEALRNASAPVTAQEIADETGIARGKIVYGLTNYWKSEVVRDDSGKTATYTLA